MNIGRIRHKGLRRLHEEDDGGYLPAAAVRKIKTILAALEYADSLAQAETVPGWRLHPLKGARKGEYSVTVTGNWRIYLQIGRPDYHRSQF